MHAEGRPEWSRTRPTWHPENPLWPTDNTGTTSRCPVLGISIAIPDTQFLTGLFPMEEPKLLPCLVNQLLVYIYVDSWIVTFSHVFKSNSFITHFIAQMLHIWPVGSSFRWCLLTFLWWSPIFFCALPYFLALQDIPGPSYIFPAPTTSPGALALFTGE